MPLTLQLPAAHGPAHDEPGPRVVMTSVLELARWRDVPAFTWAALRLRRRLGAHPASDTLRLRAAPHRRTFWTWSTWSDASGIGAFHRDPVHLEVVRRFGPHLVRSGFVQWEEAGAPTRADWDGATRRLEVHLAGRSSPQARPAEPIP